MDCHLFSGLRGLDENPRTIGLSCVSNYHSIDAVGPHDSTCIHIEHSSIQNTLYVFLCEVQKEERELVNLNFQL